MPSTSTTTIRYFGDYVLFGRIAEGAMGEVWFARQESLGRPVALKLLRAGALASPAEIERFHVEAQAAARLDHENIVRVIEIGEHEGRHFLSMELVEGQSLAQRLSSLTSLIPHQEAATLLARVARAVHHAHQHGVLHRDIKPANILLDDAGEPHLTDFGLAKLVDADAGLTRTTSVLGTLCYMSPEQASGRSAAATTAGDIYSLGAVLYELLAGRPPFSGGSMAEVMRQVIQDEPVAPSRAVREGSRSADGTKAGSRDLDVICLKCLEKAPGRRYASAALLAEDLDRWLRGEPIEARPVSGPERAAKWVRRHPVTAGLTAALVLALASGLGISTWQWHRAEEQRVLTSSALARSQLQRAEECLGSGKAHLALPILARALHDDPGNRVAQERLINALNYRAFLAPTERARAGTSDQVQLALRIARTADGTRSAFATDADARTIRIGNASVLAHSNVIRSLAFRSDGRCIISASADGTAKIWDAEALRLRTVLSHPASVQSADFSPDGERAVTAARDGIVRVWKTSTGELLFALPTQPVAVHIARFSPDGHLLACGAEDGSVRLWATSASGFQPLSEALTLSNAVWDLTFRSNSLVVVVDDGTQHTLTWTHPRTAAWALRGRSSPVQIDEGQIPTMPEPIQVVLGHPAEQFHSSLITYTNVSPDGRLLATASLDRTARLWNVRSLAPVIDPLVHVATVNCIRFSSDGHRIATSTSGGVARVWDAGSGLPLTDWIRFDQPIDHVRFGKDDVVLETSSGETWPIHAARTVAPAWLAELAESLSGVRHDETGRIVPAPSFPAVRDRILRSVETDPLMIWAQQLLQVPASGG